MSHKIQTIMKGALKQCIGQEQDQKILIIFPWQWVIWKKITIGIGHITSIKQISFCKEMYYLKRKQVTMMGVKLLLDVITKSNKTMHYAVESCVLVMVRTSGEGSQKSWKTANGLFYGINGTSITAESCVSWIVK